MCSAECEAALGQQDKGMELILQKSIQSLRASAVYCYLSGGLSAAAAVLAWFMLPLPFLILFAAACAVALIASGLWYSRAARRQFAVSPPSKAAGSRS
jgi:hypothetical protein